MKSIVAGLPLSLLLFFITISLVSETYGVRAVTRPQHDKVVACYVASWAAYRPKEGQFAWDNLHPEHCTHLIYAFAGLNSTSWKIKSLDPWADLEDNSGKGNYRKMTGLRRQYPHLKVTLGIGGWNEGSANYSAMASSPTYRRVFISSVVQFLRKYDFDGLDLDWEFPGKRGGAPHDKTNFVALVKELKAAFTSMGLLLTAAVGVDKATIDLSYDVPEISKYLDYIHVMAYDYHGTWNKQVLSNAPLRSEDGLSVEDSVKYLLKQGAPADKLVLGIPTYGRTFILVSALEKPDDSPFRAPALDRGFQGPFTREDGFMGYNEICRNLMEQPQKWRTGWEDSYSTAYAINDKNVVVYDNIRSIKEKMEYLKEMNLAGVMIWTMDTDDFRGDCAALHNEILDPLTGIDFPLIRSINMALANTSSNNQDNHQHHHNHIHPVNNIVTQSDQSVNSGSSLIQFNCLNSILILLKLSWMFL